MVGILARIVQGGGYSDKDGPRQGRNSGKDDLRGDSDEDPRQGGDSDKEDPRQAGYCDMDDPRQGGYSD